MKNRNTRMLIEVAIFAALALVLDLFATLALPLKFWPEGGSISIAMVPIFIVAYRWGVKAGLSAGFLYGLLQVISGTAYIVHPIQAFLEYFVAFTVLGFAGIFTTKVKQATNWIWPAVLGIVIASLLRLLIHIIAGIIFFSSYAPKGTPVWQYSTLYNFGYIGPSIILCAIVTVVLLKVIRQREY